MIDFHSHILPEMDDGSKDAKMSLAMLQMEREQGVTEVVFTPHFYAQQDTVAHFLKKREQSVRRLEAAAQQAGVELLAMNSRESFNATCLFYHDRMQEEKNPAIRELLEQDRAFLDEKQVQMTLAREFYLAVRLKNEKPDTAYTLLSTIETKFRDNGFTTRRAGKEDLKRLLAIYFEQNTTTERFEDYDGQRFLEATG